MPETRDWPKKAELIFNRGVAKYRREKHSGVYGCFIHHKKSGEILIRVLDKEVSCRPCHLRKPVFYKPDRSMGDERSP